MKISRLAPWIVERIGHIVGTMIVFGICIGLIAGMVHINKQLDEKRNLLPVGTDVIVKGTSIRGTITRWASVEDVVITSVKSDGNVENFTYNYTLLKRQ